MDDSNETPNNANKDFNPKDAVLVFSTFTLICAAVIIALIVYDLLTIQDLLSFKKPLTMVLSVVISSIGLLLFGVVLTLYIPSKYIDDTNKSYQHFSVLAILGFTFAGALFEEMLFRGIIQNLLNIYIENQWIAIIAATLLFVGMHFQYFKKPLMLLNIIIPSLVFGWIYFHTDNLLVPFLVHFVMNFGVTLLFKYNVIRMKG